MDETTPLIPSSSTNQNQPQDKHEAENGPKTKTSAALSQSFYFSTQPVQLPVADPEDEEEQVAFLESDDDAEDSEDDNVMDENSDHHVTFAFEDDDDDDDDDNEDDDDDDLSYEEDSEDTSMDPERNHPSSSLHLPQDQRHAAGVEQPSLVPSKPKQRKVNQRVRKKTQPTPSLLSSSSYQNNNNTPITRRSRAHSFDTTQTGYTQNTVLSEAIASVISHAKDVIVDGISEVTHVMSDVMHEEIKPVTPRPEGQHQQKLSAMALAVLVFYKVSGGPFGCEPAVRSAGNFWALLGFVLFPFVWALQEAVVTAELGSAFPEPSGSIAWVEEAFGTKAGLLCGYFHWVAGATDNALYPTLFLEYVVSYLVNLEQRAVTSGDPSPWFSPFTNLLVHDDAVRFLLCVIITILLSMLNFLGLEIVGNVSIFVCILSMSPFFILFLLGLPKVNPSRWTIMPQTQTTTMDDDGAFNPGWLVLPNFAGVIWRPFINNLYWNLNSFDVGASFAGEVKNPERVFPRAMFLSFVFVVFSYVFTLFVALGATDDSQNEWKAGHLSVVASEVVGPWLGAWTVFAAAIGNIALYEAEMSGDAYQLMGMGDRGLVPKIFSKRSKFGTPTYGIMLGTIVIIILSVASFDAIVEMLNFAYSLSLLMEYAAFVKLRITDDDVHRPYRIPLGLWGCIAFVAPSCLICVLVILIASKATYIYFMLLCGVGVIFHGVQKAAKHYDWWEYAEPTQKKRRSLQPISEL